MTVIVETFHNHKGQLHRGPTQRITKDFRINLVQKHAQLIKHTLDREDRWFERGLKEAICHIGETIFEHRGWSEVSLSHYLQYSLESPSQKISQPFTCWIL